MKNADIRMMAFDMDGTLKGSGSAFPEINCRALQECERRGIKLLFASGRTFEVLRGFAAKVGYRLSLPLQTARALTHPAKAPSLRNSSMKRNARGLSTISSGR